MLIQKRVIKRGIGLSALLAFSVCSAMSAQAALCTYAVTNEWNTGFQSSITITNNENKAINGWSVSWSYTNNTVASSWNVTLTGNNPYNAASLNWNSSIQPGQSVSFGVTGNKNGATAEIPRLTGTICGTATSSATISSVTTTSKSSTTSATISSKISSTASSKSSTANYGNCTTTTSDPDGDGYGLENNKICIVVNHTAMQITGDMGLGWNLGNTLDATGNKKNPLDDETYWGQPKTTKAMIDTLKNNGFKTLRVPVSWDDHVSGNAFTIASDWMDRVEEVVNYGLANNLYVIINIHHNNGWESPTYANEATARDRLTKLWQQIATRFNKYGDKVIFETMNEPRQESWWGVQENFDVVNHLNAAALSTIRATGGNNTKRLIMIPGYVAGGNDHQLDAIVIPNDNKLAISVHAYFPFGFALDSGGTAIFVATDVDNLFARLNTKFISKGIAVVLGEWASTNKNNLSEREKHAQYYVMKATAVKIPTIWWDNSNPTPNTGDAMGLFNREKLTWYFPTILTALQNGLK